MLQRASYTTYTLYFVSDNSKPYVIDYPVVFETRDKEAMYKYIADNYPHSIELKQFSEQRKAFFNGTFKPFLQLYITPLHCHSFIEVFSI